MYSVLESSDALELLRDDLISLATKEIYSEGRSRSAIQKEIRAKENAIEVLAERYENKDLDRNRIRQCLYSIGDNHAFLRANRDPCERMIEYLTRYFHPTQAKNPKHNLAIRSGKHGARLSHDHSKQYTYVLQSLTLWREILHGADCLLGRPDAVLSKGHRHVPSVVFGRDGLAIRKYSISAARYRTGSQPSSIGAQDILHDAFHPPQSTREDRKLGRL